MDKTTIQQACDRIWKTVKEVQQAPCDAPIGFGLLTPAAVVTIWESLQQIENELKDVANTNVGNI